MTVSDPFQAPTIPPRGDLDASSADAPPETIDLSPDKNAPLGYVIDRATGERRPKRKAGRPPKPSGSRQADTRPPSRPVDPPPLQREADMVPGQIKPEGTRRGRGRPPREVPETVPFRAGPIAKGINRLYRKAGKIVSVWDREIGRAVIECTRKDIDPDTGEPDPEDATVGEAWEEIARVNPRIRRILLKMIEGGAWGQLFMAHAPILLAILMKESILKRLPLGRLIAAFMDDSEDGDDLRGPETGQGPAGMFAGLTQEDMAQAAAMFSQFMPGAAAEMPDGQRGYATVMEPNGMQRPATADDLGMPPMNHRAPRVDDFSPEDLR